MNYNPHLPEVRANLYAHYAYLREHAPVIGSSHSRPGPSAVTLMSSMYSRTRSCFPRPRSLID